MSMSILITNTRAERILTSNNMFNYVNVDMMFAWIKCRMKIEVEMDLNEIGSKENHLPSERQQMVRKSKHWATILQSSISFHNILNKAVFSECHSESILRYIWFYKNFMDFLLRNFMFFSFKSNKKFVNINSIPKKLASTLMAQTINAFEVFVLFTRYTQFARIHLHGQWMSSKFQPYFVMSATIVHCYQANKIHIWLGIFALRM